MKKCAAVASVWTLVCLGLVSPVYGAGAIFPTPLHITREVHDPLSDKTVVLNEYGYGNRLVSVRGDVTAIADYEKGELTEIDRRAGTYSVTRFESVARLAQMQGGPASGDVAAKQSSERRELKAIAAKTTRSGRPADFFRAEGEAQSLEVALDRGVRVSREALEVLIGAAYPGTKSEQHELVLAAAAGNAGGGRAIATNAQQQIDYALPLEQVFEISAGNERVSFRSSVVRVATEPPPADVLAIPAGARLVPSRTTSVLRELEQLDGAPLRPSTKH